MGQALVPLGGTHASTEKIVDHWVTTLASTSGVGGSLKPDQIAKLAQTLAPLASSMESDARERYLHVPGARLMGLIGELSSASRELLIEQTKGDTGLGLWKEKEKLARLLATGQN